MIERQEVTRARLLEATLEVLGSRGVAGTRSRDIAAAAGVNLQAITYHFGSKDELVAQALVHAVRTWIEPARAALTGVADDPLGGLFGTVSALQQALEQARENFPTYIEALATASRDETVRGQIVALLIELRDALAASIRELRATGYIAGWVEPEPMASLIIAAGDGFVMHSTLDPESYAPEPALGQVIQLLLAARNPEREDPGRTRE
jgi:AcrR family transcriptional regulator